MNRPLRILIVEDSESDAALVIRQLSKLGEIAAKRVETAAEMRAALQDGQWDAVIADYRLPQFSAPAALALLQEKGIDLPFIVVSGSLGEDLAVRMMKAGAHDYLMKDSLTRLAPAVDRELREARGRRERRQAEEALRSETLRRRALMDASQDGIAVFNQRHEVVEANLRFSEMLGYSAEETRRLHTWDFEAAMSEAEIRAGFADLAKTKTVFETRHRRKDGTTYDVEVSASGAVVDGEPLVFTISRDISARKKADEALRVSEARFSAIFRASPMAITLSRLEDGVLLDVNKAWTELTGVGHDEALGRTTSGFGLWPRPEQRASLTQRVREQGSARGVAIELRRRTGERLSVLMSAEAVDLAGERCMLSMAVDVTEREWAEAALRDSEKTHRELVENLNDVVFTLNEAGRFAYVSPAVERVFGRPASDIAGHHYAQFVHSDDRDAAALAFRDALDGRLYPSEFRLEVMPGEYRWVRASSRPLLESGQIAGLTGVLTDISERKAAEQALKESEARFHQIFDHMSSGVAVYEPTPDGADFIFKDLNLAAERIEQTPKQDLIGKRLTEAFPGVAEFGLLDVLRRVWQTGAPERHPETLYKDQRIAGWRENYVCKLPSGEVVAIYDDVTERRRGEEALRASEGKLSAALTLAHLGPWEYDAATDIFTFNDHFYALMRTTAEREGGYTMSSERYARRFCHPDDAHMVGAEIAKSLASADPMYSAEVEHRVIFGDGQVGHIVVRIFAAKDGQGRFVRGYGVNQDVTDRMRSVEALRTSEQQLSAALKLAHLGHWEYDVAADLFTFNDHFYALLRTTAEREGGYTMSSQRYSERFFCPEDLPLVREETRKALDTTDPGYTTELTHRVIFGDGTTGHIAVRIFVVKDGQGRTVRTYGVNQDVTERLRNVEALRASEKRFRTVFEAVTDGILLANSESRRLIMANEAICRMLGYSEEELLSLAVQDIHPPEDLPAIQEAFRRQLTGEQPLATGIRLRRKDGSIFIADIHGLPFMLADTPCVLGVFRDMTAFNEMEQQLRQSQKMEAVGQLAGGVAHDFNNILCVIQGHCDLMMRSLHESDPLSKGLDQIRASGERAAALTRQLLAFSRKQPLQPEVLDLNTTVRNLESMLRRLIGEDIDLATALAADLGRVKADPGQVEQVLINLAVNARDAMPRGGKLLVETANVELDASYAGTQPGVVAGPHVMLAMTDTGCGMAKKIQERIFEPFFTTKGPGRGTGLGLSTVYGIVRQSGGHIRVESEVGRGTTFMVYLPRTEEAVSLAGAQTEQGPLRGAGERILVVEDEEGLRDIVKEILDELGYQATVAANGGEALLAVEEGRLVPDLLITDVVMPGMSGSLLVERLRRTHPDLKVLFMSGYTDDAVLRHGMLDAGTPFIQKPFKTGDLAAKVWRALRSNASAG